MLGDISKRMADPVSDAFDKHHAAFQAKEMRVLETKPHEGKTDLRLKSVDTKNFLKVVTTVRPTSQIVNVLDWEWLKQHIFLQGDPISQHVRISIHFHDTCLVRTDFVCRQITATGRHNKHHMILTIILLNQQRFMGLSGRCRTTWPRTRTETRREMAQQ